MVHCTPVATFAGAAATAAYHPELLHGSLANHIGWCSGRRRTCMDPIPLLSLAMGFPAYREMLHSLQALQKVPDEKAQDLFLMLQNNIFYVLEYREVVLHLLINYKETNSTRAYLRDVVETAHMFFKMLEKYCQGTVRVQSKKRAKQKRNKNRHQDNAGSRKDPELDAEGLEELWLTMAGEVSTCLANQITLPEEDHPIPFDAASDVPIDDQKGDCMIRIHSLLRDGKYEHAIILMRSAREVWPKDDCFGSAASAPEDELMLLKEIFLANLPRVAVSTGEVETVIEESDPIDDDVVEVVEEILEETPLVQESSDKEEEKSKSAINDEYFERTFGIPNATQLANNFNAMMKEKTKKLIASQRRAQFASSASGSKTDRTPPRKSSRKNSK
ncbi:hypothetical protein RP20_CCG012151 [Aedes albopictus]|nr:hypothetical protein RP20_CCG012151 [Aedes albopictus]